MRMRLVAAGLCVVSLSLTLAAQDVYLPSDSVSKPVVKKMVQPQYTFEAMKRRIVGEVTLQVDVRPDGTVGTVALVKSLFEGLDEEAVKAAKQWEFAPGEKDGKPVTVRTEAVIVFNLR
jgi:TonB family protein